MGNFRKVLVGVFLIFGLWSCNSPDNVVDYTNIKLLSAFLNRYGKIKPRRKTRLSIQQQRSVAKAIRKARAFKLLPYVCDVKG